MGPKRVFIPILLVVIIFAFWLFCTEFLGIKEIFLPTPQKTFSALFKLGIDVNFWVDLGSSWLRIFLGFIAAFIVAYPLVLLSLLNNSFKESVFYLVEFFRYLPVPVFIPLTILWFGVDDISKIVIIFLGTVAQMIPMFYDSAASTQVKFQSFNYAMKWPAWKYVQHVVIRGSAPNILDDSRICLGWAWTYLIIAEIVGAEHGIGYALIRAQRYLATDKIFAYILVIGILGVCTDRLLVYTRKKVFKWYE